MLAHYNLVEIGDVFYIDVLDEILAYEVDMINTVEPHELEDLAIISGEDHVTLVTCTPYAINSHRLLVRGTRIAYDKTEQAGTEEHLSKTEEHFDMRSYIAASLVLAVILMISIFLIIRRKKTGRRREK